MADKIKLTHHFPDVETLKKAWMSFVHDGGIFIPTDQVFHLGDEVDVTLTLPQNPKIFSFTAEVIWMTPRSAHQTAGVGVHSHAVASEAFQVAAKNIINALSAEQREARISDTM